MTTAPPLPAGDHLARGGAGAQERAGHVDRDDLVPVGERELDRWPTDRNAGVVDQNVDAAGALRNLAEHRIDRRLARNVGAERQRPPACSDDLGDDVSDSASSRSAMTTVAPAEASVSAAARPMPRAPPVTTATWRSRRIKDWMSAMALRSALGRKTRSSFQPSFDPLVVR